MIEIAVVVYLVMTLNCFVLYHCSGFSIQYLDNKTFNTELTQKDKVIRLRNFVVHNLNELEPKMQRDGEGNLIYSGDLKAGSIKAMKELGVRYSQLSGYYGRPKYFFFSNFFSQQSMKGYYFPFSMESNINDRMYIVNIPATMCHELAHTKGFIYEDEANLIGYLACTESEDEFFQYSGYMSVLYYVEKDFEASMNSKEEMEQYEGIIPTVQNDKVFLTKEAWAEVEKNALFSTQDLKSASHKFLETSLKANGVKDGTVSYSRVVRLLIKYYDGILW